jgi:hypothetical protein
VTLTVIEPHLSTPGHPVAIGSTAFPASAVLSAALGPDWTTKAKTIEFRALDGYVSRIDAACALLVREWNGKLERVMILEEGSLGTARPSAACPRSPER